MTRIGVVHSGQLERLLEAQRNLTDHGCAMIPNFNRFGFLPYGVHQCNWREFCERFLYDGREIYEEPLANLVTFCEHYGAVSILFGGSFVSTKKDPKDIDCVIIFRRENQIPARLSSVEIEGHGLDIFVASLDQPHVVSSFKKLLSTNWFEDDVGVIELSLSSHDAGLEIIPAPPPDIFSAIKDTYTRRRIVVRGNRNRALITVHGIRTSAEWNSEVCLSASANGWIVAPFQYGYVEATIFLDKKKRKEIVDNFRSYVFDVKNRFAVDDISVLCHSFGTYIVLSYILGFEDTPVKFDTVILTGAIISENINLSLIRNRVARIVNEKAPNDEWVEKAKKANLWQDDLFGYAGTRGFSWDHENLTEYSSDIFTHNNVIKKDVVIQRWLPILEANCGLYRREQANERRLTAGAAMRSDEADHAPVVIPKS